MDYQDRACSFANRWSEAAEKSAQDGSPALVLLLEAYQCARELNRNVWDFAVEIEALRSAGVTKSQLRWLLCKGMIEHRCETGRRDNEHREFQTHCGLSLCSKSCFVLTPQGVDLARRALESLSETWPTRAIPAAGGTDRNGVALSVEASLDRSLQLVQPRWDGNRQELWLGGYLIKRFKLPAPNQEVILAAFQEEDWPVRIDDPLPPQPDQEPKRRLHDTINGLNRHQKNPLMRFCGDGSGKGIRWERVSLLTDE